MPKRASSWNGYASSSADRLQAGRDRIRERRPKSELLGKLRQIGMGVAPVDFAKAQVEVTQRAAGCDIRERISFAVAPGPVFQLTSHFAQSAIDFFVLAVDPVIALLARRALAFDVDGTRGIADSVGKRFPSLDRDALARRLRDGPGPPAARLAGVCD